MSSLIRKDMKSVRFETEEHIHKTKFQYKYDYDPRVRKNQTFQPMGTMNDW